MILIHLKLNFQKSLQIKSASYSATPNPCQYIYTRALRERRPLPSVDPDDQDSDPDHSQNLTTCFLSHLGHFLKISLKSILNFLSHLSLRMTLHGSRRST